MYEQDQHLTHWGLDKINSILQTTFANIFSSMKMIEFQLDDLSMTLTQGHGCDIYYQKFDCLYNKMITTHPITTKRSSFIALVMVITWLDFGEANFPKKFPMCIFKVKHYFSHISEMVGPIDVKQKGKASVGYWVWYVTMFFDLTHDLDPGYFKVKFPNSCIRSWWSDWCEMKRTELIGYWADSSTLPFDHTHDLDLGVLRSEFEIVISPVSEGIGGCYGFTSKPPAARNGVNAITQKPRDGLFSNLVYTLVVIVSWPD